MAQQEKEQERQELLMSLYDARQRVAALEAALAHHDALHGNGVERGSVPSGEKTASKILSYLQLVEPEDDISDFIGREGHDESRPALGPDAPADVRPDTRPSVSAFIGQVVAEHPDDALGFKLDKELPVPNPTSAKDTPPPGQGAALIPPLSAANHESTLVRTIKASALPGHCDSVLCPSSCQDKERAQSTCLNSCRILQIFKDGVLDWNIRTGEVYTSRQWQEIAGEIPTTPFENLAHRIHPADFKVWYERFDNLLQGNTDMLNMDLRFRRSKDESWRWGGLRIVAVRENRMLTHIIAVLSDITAQREAEQALRESDEKFRALAEDSPDIISRFDQNGRFLYASPNFSRYSTFAPNLVIGKTISELDLTGEIELFKQHVRRVFKTGIPLQKKLRFLSPLLGEFVTDCRFWPEFGVNGGIVSVSTLVRDMTYSHRVAESYYALFNTMDDGFILLEHAASPVSGSPLYEANEFSIVVMNPSFGRMFPLDAPATASRRLNDLMGEDAEQWAACVRQVLTQKRPAMRMLRSVARSREFQISAYSPEENRVACIVKDVTELRRIEQEIRLNESRFAALYRLSHMDAAPEEVVVDFSLEQAVKLTGSELGYLYVGDGHDGKEDRLYWSHEVMARFSTPPPPPSVCNLSRLNSPTCAKNMTAEVVNTVEHPVTEVIGPGVEVKRYMIAPVREEGRIVCIACVANKKEDYHPSDLRQLELFISGMRFHLRRRWSVQTLQRAKETAEKANQAKNEFLANVSHELRTPLNGILGMLQVLRQSALSEEQMEYVATANFSGRSLLRIISDILDFSRIEAGRLELSPQLFDFSATVRSALGMFIHQAEQKDIRFILQLAENMPEVLFGDDARLRQIIFNLVGNAFKFTDKGLITVSCSLLPYCKKGKRCVYLAVADTGIGIPDEKLGDIFCAFTQIDGSSTRRFSGTGLGLAIVRKLVELMGGTLSVESLLGQGTTIHCSLPFDEPRQPLASAKPFQVDSDKVKPLDILVVEDDPVNQLTLQSLLNKAGYPSVCAADGRQAIEALSLHPFECIITDIQMPVMDGVELTSRIREGNTADIEPTPKTFSLLGLESKAGVPRYPIPQNIPIVALTAHAMSGDRERFLGMGMDYYLAKPVFAAELAEVLNHISMLLRSREQG